MANTGDEVIYRHYFSFVNFYKKVNFWFCMLFELLPYKEESAAGR